MISCSKSSGISCDRNKSSIRSLKEIKIVAIPDPFEADTAYAGFTVHFQNHLEIIVINFKTS